MLLKSLKIFKNLIKYHRACTILRAAHLLQTSSGTYILYHIYFGH